MPITYREITLWVGTALLLSACGQNSAPETAQAEQPDASETSGCEFFSASDAETLFGVAFKEPERSAYGSVEECVFHTVETETRPKVITIRVEGTGNPDATYEQMKELFSEDELTVGGHRALISATSQLIVITDSQQVLISLGAPGVAATERREKIIAIAEMVVSRL